MRVDGVHLAIDAYGPDGAALPTSLDAGLDEVDRIDRLMSNYKPSSPLSRVNREAADRAVPVDPGLFDFLEDAFRYGRESSGAFDITVGPLMKAWGFFAGRPPPATPSSPRRAGSWARDTSHSIARSHTPGQLIEEALSGTWAASPRAMPSTVP